MKTGSFIYISLVLVFFYSIAFCTVDATTKSQDSLRMIPRYSCNISPISLLSSAVSGNIEGFIGKNRKYSILAEGLYQFPLLSTQKGYSGGVAFRYYYSKNKFLGLYSKKAKWSLRLDKSDSFPEDYRLKTTYITVGAHWGEKIFWKKLLFVYRLGIGYPVSLSSEWSNGRVPDNDKLYAFIGKLLAYFDSELSLSVQIPFTKR